MSSSNSLWRNAVFTSNCSRCKFSAATIPEQLWLLWASQLEKISQSSQSLSFVETLLQQVLPWIVCFHHAQSLLYKPTCFAKPSFLQVVWLAPKSCSLTTNPSHPSWLTPTCLSFHLVRILHKLAVHHHLSAKYNSVEVWTVVGALQSLKTCEHKQLVPLAPHLLV